MSAAAATVSAAAEAVAALWVNPRGDLTRKFLNSVYQVTRLEIRALMSTGGREQRSP